MRGEQEDKCLGIIRKLVFCKNGQPIQNPFSHKTYLDVSDNEFNAERNMFVNSDCYKSYFGLLESDRAEFEIILRKAKPNPDLSKFPDFIFDNGFIEHFKITSSSVTRKGATHTRKEIEFHRTVDTEIEKLKPEWNATPSFDKVRSRTWICTNPEHSYENLVDSFKLQWEHHIESYKKYTGSKQIGIFLIEYPEFALSMCEDKYRGWIDGMSQGDMRVQEKFKEYRLSRDKNLLEYVYQFINEIKYVIFVNYERFEVINTKNIPYIIKLLPWDYIIHPMYVNRMEAIYNISVPAIIEKGENDDQT